MPGISPVFDQDLSLTRLERMHDDLSIVPVGAVPEGQEYRFVARQNLRAMTTNRQVQRNENLRRATGGGNAQDTDPMLPEKNGIVSPPSSRPMDAAPRTGERAPRPR